MSGLVRAKALLVVLIWVFGRKNFTRNSPCW